MELYPAEINAFSLFYRAIKRNSQLSSAFTRIDKLPPENQALNYNLLTSTKQRSNDCATTKLRLPSSQEHNMLSEQFPRVQLTNPCECSPRTLLARSTPVRSDSGAFLRVSRGRSLMLGSLARSLTDFRARGETGAEAVKETATVDQSEATSPRPHGTQRPRRRRRSGIADQDWPGPEYGGGLAGASSKI